MTTSPQLMSTLEVTRNLFLPYDLSADQTLPEILPSSKIPSHSVIQSLEKWSSFPLGAGTQVHRPWIFTVIEASLLRPSLYVQSHP